MKNNKSKVVQLVLVLTLFCISPVTVAKKASGCFIAIDACEAFQSFRKETNPDDIHLKLGKSYQILEKNKKQTAVRIRTKAKKSPSRWVKLTCGEVSSSCDKKEVSKKTTNLSVVKNNKKQKKTHTKTPEYLLALSWQPSFCESHSRKKECRTQTTRRYDADHWSLHGLWPQPRNNAYCGVSSTDKGIDRNKRWHLLEPVKLSQDTATKLAFIMPGVSSNLHRHEWIKHGTCYGTNADTYYSDAIRLTQQINESIVGKLFTHGVGKQVSLKQVRQHFDKAFGKGAGKKVDMRCDRKGRVSELWINLKGEISTDTKISSLLENSIRAGSKCKMGLIDKANN
ncbi:MAG: ribonuclease T2 [Cocleimonas sp.]